MKSQNFFDYWRSQAGLSWLFISQPYRDIRPWWHFQVRGKLWEAWYYLKCATWRRYNRLHVTTLTPTWHDRDEFLLHANFAIFCEFIEHETPFDRTLLECEHGLPADEHGRCPTCEAHISVGCELRTLYHWWTAVREVDLKRYDDMLTAWSVARGPITFGPRVGGVRKMLLPHNPEADRLFVLLHTLEAANDAKDQEMLHRLVDIRRHLWT